MCIVELGEAKGRFAQLAVLLVGVAKPFDEASLVHELDAAGAFARVEERFGRRAFGAADAAGVRVEGAGGGCCRGGAGASSS